MEKYKKAIVDMLNKNIKNSEENIRTLLKNDYDIHKITEDEYNELNEFLNKKIEEMSKKDMTEIQPNIEGEDKVEKETKQDEFEDKAKEFRKGMEIKFTPIYDGEFGKVAPKNRNIEGR